MPRQARLFDSSSGSAARGFLKFRANIPPRWIKNAQRSRKRIEPQIVEALHSVAKVRKNRPRARIAIKNCNPRTQNGSQPLGVSMIRRIAIEVYAFFSS